MTVTQRNLELNLLGQVRVLNSPTIRSGQLAYHRHATESPLQALVLGKLGFLMNLCRTPSANVVICRIQPSIRIKGPCPRIRIKHPLLSIRIKSLMFSIAIKGQLLSIRIRDLCLSIPIKGRLLSIRVSISIERLWLRQLPRVLELHRTTLPSLQPRGLRQTPTTITTTLPTTISEFWFDCCLRE